MKKIEVKKKYGVQNSMKSKQIYPKIWYSKNTKIGVRRLETMAEIPKLHIQKRNPIQ